MFDVFYLPSWVLELPLPQRKPVDMNAWHCSSIDRSLMIHPGITRDYQTMDFPYGVVARRLMGWLCTALKAQNSKDGIIELPKCRTEFLNAIGYPEFGIATKKIESFLASSFTFAEVINEPDSKVKHAMMQTEVLAYSRVRWIKSKRSHHVPQGCIQLEQAFVELIQRDLFPIPKEYFLALSKFPLAVDLLFWMLWKQSQLKKDPQFTPMRSLAETIGAQFETYAEFEKRFRDALHYISSRIDSKKLFRKEKIGVTVLPKLS